jgi:hypothetical protein
MSSQSTSVTVDGVEIPGLRSVTVETFAGKPRVLRLEILQFDVRIDTTEPPANG